jgi:hypothetical protein
MTSRRLTRLVFADQEGPFLTVQSPRHRQSVFSLHPAIAISYTDFYTTTNPAGLQVLLTAAGGGSVDVTGDLAIMPDSASGEITFDLNRNRRRSYWTSHMVRSGAICGPGFNI